MFASQTRKVVDIGDGHKVEVRKLSARQLEEAAAAAQAKTFANLRAAGPEFLLGILNDPNAEQRARGASRADKRSSTYDRATVLRHGVLRVDGEAVKAADIDDFDEASATSTFEAILDLTLPPVAEADAVGKGDAATSSAS